MNWDCESLRLTLFFQEAFAGIDAAWTAITGLPEAEIRQNLPNAKQMSGKFGNGQLALATSGSRLDVVMSAALPTQGFDENTLIKIGDWRSSKENFESTTSQWLAKCASPIIRMAFGATLLSQTKDRLEGYTVLKSQLKSVAVDPDEMRDLIFRVNWPTKSKVVKNLDINRLTNWSSIQIRSMLVQVGGGALTQAPTGPELHAVRLEIDHSTAVENTDPFKKDNYVAIYKELIALASENADKGEKP